MNTGIYLIRNVINNKVYIGSAINVTERWRIHCVLLNNNKHYNLHLQSSWNKYGEDAFEFKILFYCSKDKLIHYEQTFIDFYKFKIGWDNMYNLALTAGSQLGIKRSDEFKTKISQAFKGKKRSPESIKKISQARLGKKLSLETCMKISQAQKGKIISQETRVKMSNSHKGHIPWNKGKKKGTCVHTLESRTKISNANKGRCASKGMTGKKHSEETKKKMRISHQMHIINSKRNRDQK